MFLSYALLALTQSGFKHGVSYNDAVFTLRTVISHFIAKDSVLRDDNLCRPISTIVVYIIDKYKFLFLLPKVNKHDCGFSFW